MKNGKRILTLFAALLSLLCLTLLPVCGAIVSAGHSVRDRAGLLSAEEIAELKPLAETFAEATDGCRLYLITHEITAYCGRYYGETFLQENDLSAEEDIILLIITLDAGIYYYDLYLYGDAEARINSSEVDYILDDPGVYNNLKSGQLVEGFQSFVAQTQIAYNGRLGISYVKIGLVCLVISTVVAVLICYSVWHRYKKPPKSVDYPLDRFARLELTASEDSFRGSFVTSRRLNTESRGGGGGGGRGGGSGHAGGR